MFPSNKPISGIEDSGRSKSSQNADRPSRTPKRDFRKVVERDREERAHEKKHGVEDTGKEESPESVFELAGSKKEKSAKAKKAQKPKEESLFALAAEKNARPPVKGDTAEDLAGLTTLEEEPSVAKGRDFSQPRDDLTFVNPHAMQGKEAQLEGVNLNAGPTTMQKTDLQALVDQISHNLYTVKTGGVTDTVLTIQNPPLFAGSELTVTSYDTARGEFNIAFSNLTQEAKTLLDHQQAKLMQALEERGYVAHIVVISTEPREVTIAQANASDLGRPNQEKEQGEQDEQEQGQEQQGS